MTPPVAITSVATALADPQLLGAALPDLTSWKAWVVILKAAFAEPLDDDELVLFKEIAGGREPPEKPVRELWVLAGRRSGKTHIAGALAVHAATMVKHKLAPGEKGVR